ncbi:LysR family transcriptional regulator [Pseudoroseomonas wenyumeiae]
MTLLVDSLLSLQTFVHAAELRSFRLAGQQMGLSSSGIGKSIQRLEEQLGIRLFHRTTRSITLTEEGRMFLERSRRVLTEMEGARADLARSTEAPRGRLKVSMPVANFLFTPIMSAFMREYPEVTLELDFNDRFVDVIEEGLTSCCGQGTQRQSSPAQAARSFRVAARRSAVLPRSRRNARVCR